MLKYLLDIILFLSTCILSYLLYKHQRAENKLTELIKQVGLSNIKKECKNYGTDDGWKDLIKNAENEIDIIGYSMNTTLSNSDLLYELKRHLERSKFNLRIILADPYSSMAQFRAASIGKGFNQFTTDIYNTQNELLKILKPNDIIIDRREIRTFSELFVPYSLIRIDNKMLYMPYLSSFEKKKSPLLILEKTEKGLFKRIKDDFNNIWKNSSRLHSPRINVPEIYNKISSEKYMIAEAVYKKITNKKLDHIIKLNCLDIGCGDGGQSMMIFNRLSETINDIYVNLMDPSIYAKRELDNNLKLKERTFILLPNYFKQTKWQDYNEGNKFHFIFCGHTLGSIYHQCGETVVFRSQLEKMISKLEKNGVLCIILASEKSIELLLRRRELKIDREILSAEIFSNYMDEWNIKYEQEHVKSYFSLDGWLGAIKDDVEHVEAEMLYFLFSPYSELTPHVVDPYRKGLQNHAIKWHSLSEKDKLFYRECCNKINTNPDDNIQGFGEMIHVCFWLTKC